MTPELPPPVRKMLDDSGALLSGHFILTSGRHSGNYLQCALLCSRPDFCEELARGLAARIVPELGADAPELVVAPALGGVVIGYEMARQLGTPGLFTERDKDSVMCLRRGFGIGAGRRVLLVEDVITTGGSILEARAVVEAAGGRVVGYACLFDRSAGNFRPGPPVFSVASLTFPTWPPEECPLCAAGAEPAVKPGSRK